jgi:ActR/RegA family two-component response regulator
MEKRLRVLFVDDEQNIRLTLPAILQQHGFEVSVAATVAEALAIISRERFDVLLSDLNIGQPGDGFVVVSAMRRTQPDAVTMIITGYPAFESALEAIRNQVDDYITKPAEIPKLVETMRQKVVNRQPYRAIVPKRATAIIRENRNEIVRQWLMDITRSSETRGAHLRRDSWSYFIPDLLASTIEAAECGKTELSADERAFAKSHGEKRREQGFSASMLTEEIRLLLHVIGATIQNNLLAVDLSHVIPDLLAMADFLSLMLRESLRGLSGLSEAASV